MLMTSILRCTAAKDLCETHLCHTNGNKMLLTKLSNSDFYFGGEV